MTTEASGRVELRQSTTNALQLPLLIAVVVLALVISEVTRGPSLTVLLICAVAAVLDAWLAAYLARNFKGRLVVTPDEITFTRGRAARQEIRRVDGSSLTFRTARNGPMGSQYTGYVLMLSDRATGQEVFAGAFGRGAVRRACESQGWLFG